MVEEINVKAIQKQKAESEKTKKVAERKAQKEEIKQEKMLKVKKNTCLNKSAAVPVPVEQPVVFSEYKDTFILTYFELIAKMASKYLKNVSEESLKKRLLTSRDLDKLLGYLTNLEIDNPILLLMITTVSHMLTDSIHNKVIKDAQPKPETSPSDMEIKQPEEKSNPSLYIEWEPNQLY